MNSIWKLHIQETSQWKGVCQEPFLKQGKQGENTEVRQITQEPDWNLYISYGPCGCLLLLGDN